MGSANVSGGVVEARGGTPIVKLVTEVDVADGIGVLVETPLEDAEGSRIDELVVREVVGGQQAQSRHGHGGRPMLHGGPHCLQQILGGDEAVTFHRVENHLPEALQRGSFVHEWLKHLLLARHGE